MNKCLGLLMMWFPLAVSGCFDSFEAMGATPSSSAASTAGSGAAEGSGGAAGSGGAGAASSSASGTGGAPFEGLHAVAIYDQDDNQLPFVDLVVNDASGAVVALSRSDATGQAQVTVPEGGSVSAFYADGKTLRTMVIVAPRTMQPLAFRFYVTPLVPIPAVPTVFKTMSFGLPPATTKLVCKASCGSGEGVDTCDVWTSGCPYVVHEDVAVIAYEGSMPIAWGIDLHVPTNPGGTVDVPVAVTEPMAMLDTLLTGAPLEMTSRFAHADAWLSPRVAMTFELTGNTPGDWDVWLHLPEVAPDGYDVLEGVGSNPYVERNRHYDTLPVATTFDVSGTAIVGMDPVDLSDPSRPEIVWHVGPGSRGDLGTATLAWIGSGDLREYTVVFPTEHATSLKMAEVPPNLAAFAPDAASTLLWSSVSYVEHEIADDYGEALWSYWPQADPKPDGIGTVTSGAVGY